jgi:hypothetical protein
MWLAKTARAGPLMLETDRIGSSPFEPEGLGSRVLRKWWTSADQDDRAKVSGTEVRDCWVNPDRVFRAVREQPGPQACASTTHRPTLYGIGLAELDRKGSHSDPL